MALPMLTQTELVDKLAWETGYTKSEIRVMLVALNDLVAANLGDCKRTKLAGLIIEPALKKSTKKRTGRNPATGEEIVIQAKPASVRVKLTATKPLKEAAPSVQRLRKRIAA